MEHGIPRDACVVDQDIHRPKLGLHLRQPLLTRLIARDIPLEDGNPGFLRECIGLFIIAGIDRRHLAACVLQRFCNRRTDTTRPARNHSHSGHSFSPAS